jgi:hypothetical protein
MTWPWSCWSRRPQILLLVAMAAFIPEAGGERGAASAVAAGVLFAVLAVLWLLAARGDRPQYRRTSGLFVTGTAACAAALAATALLPASARETLTGVVGGQASQPVSALTTAVGLVAVVVGFGQRSRPARHPPGVEVSGLSLV